MDDPVILRLRLERASMLWFLFEVEATELEPGGTKPANQHPWTWLLQRVFAVDRLMCTSAHVEALISTAPHYKARPPFRCVK
jgi:hypothetical protein